VLEYARKLASTPGRFDGLYWPADAGKGEEASPLGPLIAQSAAYLAGHGKGDAYRGYRFRILTRKRRRSGWMHWTASWNTKERSARTICWKS